MVHVTFRDAEAYAAWAGKRTLAKQTFAIGDYFEEGGTVHAPIDALDVSLFIGEGSAGFWIGF